MLSKGWALIEGDLYKQKEVTAWRNSSSPDLVADSLSLPFSYTHTHTHTIYLNKLRILIRGER